MFFKLFNLGPVATPKGVCNSCTYNSGTLSIGGNDPNHLKESSYMSRYNTMRHIENQGKGCPS